MPGVVYSHFSRLIKYVGLYVPSSTVVLLLTALMLGVPIIVTSYKKIVVASLPRLDGSITPKIIYIVQKIGVESIVLASSI